MTTVGLIGWQLHLGTGFFFWIYFFILISISSSLSLLSWFQSLNSFLWKGASHRSLSRLRIFLACWKIFQFSFNFILYIFEWGFKIYNSFYTFRINITKILKKKNGWDKTKLIPCTVPYILPTWIRINIWANRLGFRFLP